MANRSRSQSLIEKIASILTDDPDIFLEEALPDSISSNSMTPTDINQEAEYISGGDNDSSKQVEQQIKDDDEKKRIEQEQRKKVLEPQMRKIEQATRKVDTNIQQGQEAAIDSVDQYNSMDKEMSGIHSLLDTLGKNML